jgi:dihydroorotase
MDGKELSDIEEMVKAGVKALSEDGKSVADANLLKAAFELCKKYGIPMLSHCEDISLAAGGVMNEGARAKELNLKGISAKSEYSVVARDIALARETGAALHICHVSVAESVEIIREAKKQGVNVTAEAAPHHFILTENDVDGTDANYKMNPPLRSENDKAAIIEGLRDGTIDCIATDHAPHAFFEKNTAFKDAANGIVGLETSFPLSYTYLVKTGVLTPLQLAEKMSYNPAKILKTGRGVIQEDYPADITIVNPNAEYVLNSSEFKSKSKNTPFSGFSVSGRVEYTISNC